MGFPEGLKGRIAAKYRGQSKNLMLDGCERVDGSIELILPGLPLWDVSYSFVRLRLCSFLILDWFSPENSILKDYL